MFFQVEPPSGGRVLMKIVLTAANVVCCSEISAGVAKKLKS